MLQRVLFKTSTFLYPTYLSSFLLIFLLLFTAKHPQTSSTLPSCSFSLEIISLWLLLSSFFLLQYLLLPLLLSRFSRVQLCATPIDDSPPGSPIPGILQARTLEWVAFSFSNAWKWKVKVKSLSRVWLLVTSWTTVYQAPPSMGISRQKYWSGVPLPSPTPLSSIHLKINLFKAFPTPVKLSTFRFSTGQTVEPPSAQMTKPEI